jgi:hypothetical protein
MVVLLTDSGEHQMQASGGLFVSAADALRATGWELKPEGMCRGDQCVPLPPNAMRPGAQGGAIDLQALWNKLGAPIVHDDSGQVWSLGEAAQDRNAALAGLMAPDFTLPDLAGTPHTLSALRGRKVFLSTWASW